MNALQDRIENRLREQIGAAERAMGSGDRLELDPLFSRLADVIEVVEGIRDYSVEPYRDRVREIVCSSCRQDPDGRCSTRDSQTCGLDKHFDLIVAVVEEELKHDPGLPQSV